MNKNQLTKEKICAFYTSDYHFEMITLPYIHNKLEENKEIVIFTEDNLNETATKLINNISLSEEKREQLLGLDWSNDDFSKIKYIKSNIKDNGIIFIKGNRKYIDNINANIDMWRSKLGEIKIIDCYNLEEIGEDMKELAGKYQKMLITSGEKEI